MSEIQHTNRAHARLNASSSHRWMMCPPSVKLSEQFEDKPSTYAEEGTFCHELCELKLRRYLGDMTAEAVEAQYAEHRDSEFYSDETESVTDEYVAFCIETIEAVRSSCPDPLIMVEHRLDYSEYVPEGFGTGDLVIVADGIIKVIDFKSGRGVRVDANRNSQLMLYALGALLEFDPLYDIHHVRMTIVQEQQISVTDAMDVMIRWFCLLFGNQFSPDDVLDGYPVDRLMHDIALALMAVQTQTTEILSEFPTKAAKEPTPPQPATEAEEIPLS